MSKEMIDILEKRSVTIEDIIDCVAYLEEGYNGGVVDRKSIEKNIVEILDKREVKNVIRTGVALDVMAEQGLIPDEELQGIIQRDDSLYGVDEVLAYGICNLYGSIALTNFGYIDRVKPGIIGTLNDETNGTCNTYLDDIIGAIAASAASKNAHRK